MPKRLTIATFWGAIAFTFVMATLPHPPQPPGHLSDKTQHILAFTVVTALGLAAYPRLKPLRLAIALSLFGVVIEVVQAIPSLHRDSDWRDWVADTLAILVVLLIAAGVRRLRRR